MTEDLTSGPAKFMHHVSISYTLQYHTSTYSYTSSDNPHTPKSTQQWESIIRKNLKIPLKQSLKVTKITTIGYLGLNKPTK